VSARRELRKEVVKAVIREIYPKMDEKHAFRALVAPVLTRLHFAKSQPPFFRSRPNARIWKDVGEAREKSYTSIVLFDFAKVRLGLAASLLPPAGNLRTVAEKHGDRVIDRVRGLNSLLKLYAPFHPSYSKTNDESEMKVAKPDHFNHRGKQFSRLITSSLVPGRMTVIDEARYLVLVSLMSQGIFASSFVLDEWFKVAVREGLVAPVKAPYASIDSLLIDRTAINAVISQAEH
jgi:hypothetical protein